MECSGSASQGYDMTPINFGKHLLLAPQNNLQLQVPPARKHIREIEEKEKENEISELNERIIEVKELKEELWRIRQENSQTGAQSRGV